MSDTPRTDAARQAYADWRCGALSIDPERPDGWGFARQLERELAAAKKTTAELEKERADFHMAYRMKCDEAQKKAEAELAAANARLAFRGKETDGAFCDGCAAWEDMAWEATVKLKAIEAALDAAKTKE